MHFMLTGTSVAAAGVAGAVASSWRKFPGLDPASVKAILATRGLQDEFTGTVPNPRWGLGKLCLTLSAQTGLPDFRDIDSGLRLGAAFPNPVRQLTRVPLHLPEAGRIRVAVYDVSGRLLRGLHEGFLPAGEHVFTWDGRTDQGSGGGLGPVLRGGHQPRRSPEPGGDPGALTAGFPRHPGPDSPARASSRSISLAAPGRSGRHPRV